jgi:predicted ribosome quality control (RQC) complex YloA/Tae2 family protein
MVINESMKKDLSAFDLMVLAREYQSLCGAFVENVYQPTKDEFVLRVRSKKLGKKYLRFKVGKWLTLEDELEDNTQSDFSNSLKKFISNAKVESVEQVGFERILEIGLQKKDRYELIIEFIPPGNVILIKDGDILRAMTVRKWKDRHIKPGNTYKSPPERLNVPRLSTDDFIAGLKRSSKSLVKALALEINLGGLYAEELCLRSGVDKNRKAKDLDDEDLESLHRELEELVLELKDSPKPNVVLQEDQPIDVVPTGLRSYMNLESKDFKTMNEAIGFFLGGAGTEMKEEILPESGEHKRIKRIISTQKDAQKKWESEIMKSQNIAELIYRRFTDIDEIIKELRTDKTYSSPSLRSFNRKDKTAMVRFDDIEFKISIDSTIHENVQVYYDRAKKAKEKLESVKEAIKKSKKELKKADKTLKRAKVKRAGPRPRRKKFWYERFKWFISSEDFLVIGGKDAKTNEMLFRKHLKSGDRYAHADITGAPTIIVREGSKATEKTLKEACQFALAHSKVWNQKVASGTAYWVNPEQVSKTPESGEYLARGAFVIRGKRNYFRKLELVLALGEVKHKDEELVMCGPPDAIVKTSKRYVLFRPGDRKKNVFAKEMAKDFGVSVDDILPILPPGDVDVVEKRGL